MIAGWSVVLTTGAEYADAGRSDPVWNSGLVLKTWDDFRQCIDVAVGGIDKPEVPGPWLATDLLCALVDGILPPFQHGTPNPELLCTHGDPLPSVGK